MNIALELIVLVISVRVVTAGRVASSQILIDYKSVKNVTSTYGRNVTLHCPFDAAAGQRNAWIRYDTRTLLSMQGERVIQSERYAIENKEGIYDLVITGVKESDAGTYICQINTEPMENIIINLSVMRSPRIVAKMPNDNLINVEEGHSTELGCSALGNPEPTIEWRRVDKRPLRSIGPKGQVHKDLIHVGETLVLPPLRRSDAGKILCIARNGYSPSPTNQFKLVVHYKPKISIHVDVVKVSSKYFARIVCRIDAVPYPNVMGISIKGQLLDTRITRQNDDGVIELHFDRSVEFGSMAKCFAENTAGHAAKHSTIPELTYSTVYQDLEEPEIYATTKSYGDNERTSASLNNEHNSNQVYAENTNYYVEEEHQIGGKNENLFANRATKENDYLGAIATAIIVNVLLQFHNLV